MTVTTDRTWKHQVGPLLENDLLMGEAYDARLEMPGWDQPGFDDHTWSRVWTQPRNQVPLVSQFSQPVRKICELSPVSVKEVKPGVYVFDFGQERALCSGDVSPLV